jgi:hypothetical protein
VEKDGVALYLWRPHLCPSCRTERDPAACHLCGAPVGPKTWADLRLDPPPWDPLVGEIETLAGRVSSERRVVLSDLALALEGAGLTDDEAAVSETLVRAYLTAGAREMQRRMDRASSKAKSGSA